MFRRFWRAILRLATGLAAAAILLTLYQWLTWPDVAALADSDPQTSAFLERYRRRAVRQGLPEPAWRWVPYSAISNRLKRAVLVSEDIGFFSHEGFAVDELKIAVREWREGEKPLRGASTLTQQLAKNLWLSPSRNPVRKVKEALLTVQLERHLSKRRILELYLNVVEFGPGIYGAEAASQHYFRTSAARLSERQAAELAASLPRPASWNPTSDSSSYRRRIAAIERRMERARWLEKEL